MRQGICVEGGRIERRCLGREGLVIRLGGARIGAAFSAARRNVVPVDSKIEFPETEVVDFQLVTGAIFS